MKKFFLTCITCLFCIATLFATSVVEDYSYIIDGIEIDSAEKNDKSSSSAEKHNSTSKPGNSGSKSYKPSSSKPVNSKKEPQKSSPKNSGKKGGTTVVVTPAPLPPPPPKTQVIIEKVPVVVPAPAPAPVNPVIIVEQQPVYPQTSTYVPSAYPYTPVTISHGRNRSKLAVANNYIPSSAYYSINNSLKNYSGSTLYKSLFIKDKIQDVYISIDKNNLDYILQNAGVLAQSTVLSNYIKINGTTVNYVGLKLKNDYSLSDVNNSSNDRFSFTVRFDAFVNKTAGYSADQTLYGLREVNFNNFSYDKSMLYEYNRYRLFSEFGLSTPEYCFVRLYINEEYFGLYLMTESNSDSMSGDYGANYNQNNSWFNVGLNNLRYNYGSDVLLDSAIDIQTGTFSLDALIRVGAVSRAWNGVYYWNKSLEPYAYIWNNNAEDFQKCITELPAILSTLYRFTMLSQGKDYRGVSVDFNSERFIELLNQIIDVDSVLKYFAVESFFSTINTASYGTQSISLNSSRVSFDNIGRIMLLPSDRSYVNTYQNNYSASSVNFYGSNTGSVQNTATPNSVLYNLISKNDTLRNALGNYIFDSAKIVSLGGILSNGRYVEASRYVQTNNILRAMLIKDLSKSLGSNIYYMAYQSKNSAVVEFDSAVTSLNGALVQNATNIYIQNSGRVAYASPYAM